MAGLTRTRSRVSSMGATKKPHYSRRRQIIEEDDGPTSSSGRRRSGTFSSIRKAGSIFVPSRRKRASIPTEEGHEP